MFDSPEMNTNRLSDRILYALQFAIEQEDVKIADALARILEMSMTRNAGGGEFVERRDYPPYVEKTLDKLKVLKKQMGY